jgi:F0F1-type ATP synthase membrane subunit b/b'
MNVDAIVLFDLLAAVFVLSMALITLAISYSKLAKRLSENQRRYEEMSSSFYQRESGMIEEARNKAQKIVEEASVRASQIIKEGKSLTEDSYRMLDASFSSLVKHQSEYFGKETEKFAQEYKTQLANLKQRILEISQKASKDIETDTLEGITDFENILEQETVKSQKIVGEKIEKEYQEVEKDISKYKDEMLRKVDEDIYKIVENISKMAIGRSLTLQDHENLILDALNKAKKDVN